MAGLTIVERYTQPVYDGWKVDTRDGNGNINVDAPFRKKMRLFTGTSSNPRMSNMMIPGRLVADRTGMVKRVGVFSSFSMESHKLLFKKEVMSQLFIHGEPIECNMLTYTRYRNSLLEFCQPVKNHENGCVIAPRMSLHMDIESGDEFYEEMKNVEAGRLLAYAEITGILDMSMTREVQ